MTQVPLISCNHHQVQLGPVCLRQSHNRSLGALRRGMWENSEGDLVARTLHDCQLSASVMLCAE